jgi:hypothetical protein
MEPNATYAVLILCARDAEKLFERLYDANDVSGDPVLFPKPDYSWFGYLTAQNWAPLGQLRCDDDFILDGVNCCFGVLLQCTVAFHPFAVGDYLLAVRGSVTPLEWLADAVSEVADYSTGNVGGVGEGFWDLYSTMSFTNWDGSGVQADAAKAVVDAAKDPNGGPRRLWVSGDSLGGVLATYLTADIQKLLPGTSVELKPYFFASPKPGTKDYVDNYQATIPAYDLVNYAADVVPLLPSTPPFRALNGGGATHNVHIIALGTPGGPLPSPNPLITLKHNHSPVAYARMLDPNNQVAQKLHI